MLRNRKKSLPQRTDETRSTFRILTMLGKRPSTSRSRCGYPLSSEYANFGLNFTEKTNNVKFLPTLTDGGRGCFNFLAIFPSLGHQNASAFLPWYGSTLLPQLGVPALPDQVDLRCIFSGTGAVPTVKVTLLSTRES